jgi:hypothetical protein
MAAAVAVAPGSLMQAPGKQTPEFPLPASSCHASW